ncbi:MAG: GNAT family N-acetyltransferase [Rhodocyclaceae bacterium]|nr:GNAT family N-acetyltransferase [Rhodocyclaceae bacterium]MCB1961565.1 GNAT family N-acetyltransferase [Rhodocyclaceae bacterium]
MAQSGLAHTLKWLGIGNGLLYLAGRVLQKISGNRACIIRYRFVAQPVPTEAPALATGGATRIWQAASDDPIVAAFPRPQSVIAKRFSDDGHCFVAQSKDAFAGFLWLARGGYEEDEVRCHYALARPDRTAWDYDVYIAPRFRLGRMFTRLWQSANHYLRTQGIDWTLSRISTFNADSLAAHARLGARSLGHATFIVIGPLQLSVLSMAPYLHLSLSATSRPVVSLAPPSGD